MKNLKIPVLLFLLAALFAVNQSNAQVVHEEFGIDFDCGDDFLPPFCLEEDVSGYLPYNLFYWVDDDGNITNTHYNSQGGILTGCETGMKYKIIDASPHFEAVKINKNNDQQVWKETFRIKFIGQKGVKFDIYFILRMTINGNGELKVEKIRIFDECGVFD